MIKEYKPLYRVKEVAEILTINTTDTYRIIKKGELPCLIINNAMKVRGSDLEKFIESHPVAEKSEIDKKFKENEAKEKKDVIEETRKYCH